MIDIPLIHPAQKPDDARTPQRTTRGEEQDEKSATRSFEREYGDTNDSARAPEEKLPGQTAARQRADSAENGRAASDAEVPESVPEGASQTEDPLDLLLPESPWPDTAEMPVPDAGARPTDHVRLEIPGAAALPDGAPGLAIADAQTPRASTVEPEDPPPSRTAPPAREIIPQTAAPRAAEAMAHVNAPMVSRPHEAPRGTADVPLPQEAYAPRDAALESAGPNAVLPALPAQSKAPDALAAAGPALGFQSIRPEKPEQLPRDRVAEIDAEMHTAAVARPALPAAARAAPPPPMVAQLLLSQAVATSGPDVAEDLSWPSDADAVLHAEFRTAAGTATALPVMARPDTPLSVSRQMAEAIQRATDGRIEISLNPRELGRLRMNLSASDTGVAVHVLAERAETVDLMRRNIDILTREFQNLGYQNISFSFAEGQRRDAASTGTPDPVPEKEEPALRLDLDAFTLASNVPGGVAAGLDIRL